MGIVAAGALACLVKGVAFSNLQSAGGAFDPVCFVPVAGVVAFVPMFFISADTLPILEFVWDDLYHQRACSADEAVILCIFFVAVIAVLVLEVPADALTLLIKLMEIDGKSRIALGAGSFVNFCIRERVDDVMLVLVISAFAGIVFVKHVTYSDRSVTDLADEIVTILVIGVDLPLMLMLGISAEAVAFFIKFMILHIAKGAVEAEIMMLFIIHNIGV